MFNEEIMRIKECIINALPVEKLYLFGSYAYGTPNEDSDYDFYIVIPNNSMRPLEAMEKAFRSMHGMKRKPVDILAGTTEVFERRSKWLSTVEREIFEKGVVLYEKK